MRAMTEKLKEHAVTYYRWYCSILLTLIAGMTGVGVYFAKMINDKIEYSYKATVEQRLINEERKDHDIKQDEIISINDKRMDILSERFYSIEAIVKYNYHTTPKPQ